MAFPRNKKKKTDYAALYSPFMRIPRMDVRAARALLDAGIREVYELRGRDPEAVFADIRKMRPGTPGDILGFLKIAVEFADAEDSR